MGFPQTFYCVCEERGCLWNRPCYQAFGRVVVHVGRDGAHRYIEPDDRPTRIAGSPYWNTCRYFAVIVFEAMFLRTLRNLVRDRVVSPDALPEVLCTLVRERRYDREFLRLHAGAIKRIAGELSFLERELGMMNGHLLEIARLVRHLVFQNRALLDDRREPHYWPTRAMALDVMRAVSAHRRAVRAMARGVYDRAPVRRGPQPAQGHILTGRRVA